jgi:hypothetical protein
VTRSLAQINVILQVLLMVAALTAFWLARRRRFSRHCLIMRVSIGVEIILIAGLMAPSLAAYINTWSGWSWFTATIIIHHTLGAFVILFFIYFNLALTGVVRSPRRLRPYMRTALVLWLAMLGLGIYLYWYIWR